MNKILIIGTLPNVSGIGGVTIHIDRLLQNLTNKQVAYDFCDYKEQSLVKVVRAIIKHKVVHIHPSNPLFRVLLVSISKILGKKVIFTIHGNLGRHSRVKNWLDKLSVKMSDIPILINLDSYTKAHKWNSASVLLSAFIPPIDDECIQESIKKQVELIKSQCEIVVVTNASVMSFADDGKEIYGIDFLIKYFEDKPQYALVVSDPSGQYTSKYSSILLPNVLFISDTHSFYALMKNADIMIRATSTDGDSLSVKEALHLGIKVLATDCVSRPNGVILFKYCDSKSLDFALSQSVVEPDIEDEIVVDKLIEIYNSLN